MVFRERHQKNKSIQFAAKNPASNRISISVLIVLSACAHHRNQVPADVRDVLNKPDSPALKVSSLGLQLTQIGENHSPSISKDGKRLVFISQKRPSHPQAQVYLFNLETLREKRITFQDGDCSSPSLMPGDKEVIYASTTDELKERPLLFQKHKDQNLQFPPTEIYISQISGSNVDRITHRPGFDGFPLLHPTKKDSILYSQLGNRILSIWQLNLAKGHSETFLSKKNRSLGSLQPSPNGQLWAWIEKDPADDSSSQIVLGQAPSRNGSIQELSIPKGLYTEVRWMNEDKLIFAGRSLKKNSQIYAYDLKSQCLQSLVESETDLSDPRPHPDSDGLIFVSTINGTSQIFYRKHSVSSECLKWAEEPKK